MPEERKSKLPLKDQIGDKTKVPDTTNISNLALVANQIDEKVNLKKLFSELIINEDGRIMSSHLARLLKAALTKDNQTLKPSDYLPIIKGLDS